MLGNRIYRNPPRWQRKLGQKHKAHVIPHRHDQARRGLVKGVVDGQLAIPVEEEEQQRYTCKDCARGFDTWLKRHDHRCPRAESLQELANRSARGAK